MSTPTRLVPVTLAEVMHSSNSTLRRLITARWRQGAATVEPRPVMAGRIARDYQREIERTIHPCPTCDVLTCAPEYQRVPHTCRRAA